VCDDCKLTRSWLPGRRRLKTGPGQEPGAYLGYDYVRFNSASNVAAFSANGGSGQFIHSLRYSGGFTFWFGGEKAAPQANRQVQHKTCPDGSTTVPANAACPKLNFSMTLTATPSELCPGETARLVPSLSGASPNQLSFSSWSVNGQQVSQVCSYEFQSEGPAPGIYRVKLSTGGDAYNSASAETTITVRGYQLEQLRAYYGRLIGHGGPGGPYFERRDER